MPIVVAEREMTVLKTLMKDELGVETKLPITPLTCTFITSSPPWGPGMAAEPPGPLCVVCWLAGCQFRLPGGGVTHPFSLEPGPWQAHTDFVERTDQHVSECGQPLSHISSTCLQESSDRTSVCDGRCPRAEGWMPHLFLACFCASTRALPNLYHEPF